MEILHGFQPFTNFTKSSFIDAWQGPKYVSASTQVNKNYNKIVHTFRYKICVLCRIQKYGQRQWKSQESVEFFRSYNKDHRYIVYSNKINSY